MPKIPEKWRWRIVSTLNRSRRFCWADLVLWAIQPDDDEGTLRACMTGRVCAAERDTAPDGACYCGKFRDAKDRDHDAAQRKERITDRVLVLGVVLAMVVAIAGLAVAVVLWATARPSYPDPTMTGCREVYGTCTEDGR